MFQNRSGLPHPPNEARPRPLGQDHYRRCRTCNKSPNSNTKRCSKCKEVYYCSRECQIKDFPQHRNGCAILQEFRDAREVSSLVDAGQHDGFDSIAAFRDESYLELSYALSTPLNLLSSSGRKLKTYSGHSIVLEYSYDPTPAQVRQRYKIVKGTLENIDTLCKAASKEGETDERMRYYLSDAGLRAGRDTLCEELEQEAKRSGDAVIRVPVYFKHVKGQARLVLPVSIVLMSEGWDREGEVDWVGGLNLGLQLPRVATMCEMMARLTARDNMRDLLSHRLGNQRPIKPFATAPAPNPLPSKTSTPLTFPLSLQSLIDSPLRCDPLHCTSPETPSSATALTRQYQELCSEVLQRSFNSFSYVTAKRQIVPRIVDDEIDIQCIVQSIIFGGMSLDEMAAGKKFGDSLGTRLILEVWHSSPSSPVFDRIVGATLKFAELGIMDELSQGCLHNTLSTNAIQTNMAMMERMGPAAEPVKRDLPKHRKYLIELVDDLIKRQVVQGSEWEDKSIWSKKLYQIHDAVFAGLDVGVKSLVSDPTFMPIQKHFFANFDEPCALIKSAAKDLNLEGMVKRLGLFAESEFMLRGGLLEMAEAQKKKSKAQKKKEKRKVVMEKRRLAQDESGSMGGSKDEPIDDHLAALDLD